MGGVPGAYLLQRIRDDASGDDAVALGARRKASSPVLSSYVFRRGIASTSGSTYRVEHLQGADKDVLQRLVDATIVQLRARRVGMCSARLSSDALTALHCLESSGFRYVELTLAPWRDLSTWEPKGFGVTRPAETRDLGPVCDIARTVFRTDRFHRDLRFDRAAADSVYEKWVCSWYADQSPSRFSRVLVLNGEVAGFFMFELLRLSGRTGDVVAGIVLNGVDSSRSGLGYGFKMYCDALDVASEAAELRHHHRDCGEPCGAQSLREVGVSLHQRWRGDHALVVWGLREGAVRILVTGGAGFIGSTFVKHVLATRPDDEVLVLDALTYAGNLENLNTCRDDARSSFWYGNVTNSDLVHDLVRKADVVVHFAAESHVARSIYDNALFFMTDVIGTQTVANAVAKSERVRVLVHISTSEVYGTAVEEPMTKKSSTP